MKITQANNKKIYDRFETTIIHKLQTIYNVHMFRKESLLDPLLFPYEHFPFVKRLKIYLRLGINIRIGINTGTNIGIDYNA